MRYDKTKKKGRPPPDNSDRLTGHYPSRGLLAAAYRSHASMIKQGQGHAGMASHSLRLATLLYVYGWDSHVH